MKILITGSTGFVGQNFIPYLFRNFPDAKVITINRDVAKASLLYQYNNITHLSINEINKIKQFNPELVFHFAALSTSRNDSDIIHPLIAANIEFGVLLLDILRYCNNLTLFVNIGSFAEYRLGPKKIDDSYLYTASKSAFKIFLEYYSKLCSFKFIHLVPYTIYGGKDTAKKLINYIIDSLDAKEPIKMTAGEQILDFIHVNDIVNFFLFLVENFNTFSQVSNGEEFHLGTGKGTQVRELALLVESIYKKKCNVEWGGLPYRDRDTMYAVAPIANNLELLGWRTQIDLKKGIEMMIENKAPW